MNLEQRLKILGKRARFDLCGDCDKKGTGRVHGAGDRWHYPELVPDGERSIMLRVLMTNRCENNCFYCENAAGRDFREASIIPDELASHFAALYASGRARSLFLSSAVQKSAEYSMTRMVEALELIRFKYRVPGYIHAKILPGTPDSLIERTLRLATRVSVNLEVPGPARMEEIGAPKDFHEGLYGRVRHISRLLEDPLFRKKTQTTQFIVGAGKETDREFLSMMGHLYQDLKLARIYFSAYQPPGRLDFGAPGTPLLREHRLYQSDFLLRKYGFEACELPLDGNGNLLESVDPKTAWVRLHPERFPVEINTAEKRDLLRVPGIGPISVRRILKGRRQGKITSSRHLESLGVRAKPALPYLLFDGAKARGDEGKPVQGAFGF